MTERLTKIVTRQGDDGYTRLLSGRKLKCHPVIHALGEIDELNSCIGNCSVLIERHGDLVERIQQKLFDIGGQIAVNNFEGINEADVEALDDVIYHFNRKLPTMQEFILPRGPIHVARAVCRRAERSIVYLGTQHGPDMRMIIMYLNRLSDLLFVVARECQTESEIMWSKK